MALGPDFLQLDPAGAPRGALTTWLTDALRSATTDGRLRVGDRLPSSRLLATDLGVSRGVVVAAYERLVDEGVAVADGARGTVVAAAPRRATPSTGRSATAPAFDLSPGVPDLSAFPRAAWLRAERAVLAEAGPADLGYGDPQGNPVLRAALVGWLGRIRGVRAEVDDIVVVAGVAQALALIAQVLVDRGADSIAVEDPGSRGAHDELAYWGLEPVPVPVDADGLDVGALVRTGQSRCCSPPPTTSRPAWCSLRGAGASCWPRRPGSNGSSRTTTTPSTATTGPRCRRCRRWPRTGSSTPAACPRPWPRPCGWAG
jgi:GntR family transcriptional regulator/MocR family aminotransferase